jgi:cation diffusion facilitator family transporter
MQGSQEPHQASADKARVALTSIFASAALTVAKAIVGVLTGSLGLLSEAAHSLIDVVATVMTYFAVRWADAPADEEHQYGHGKIESVAALAETALLFFLSVIVIWEAGKRLLGLEAHTVETSIWAFVVITGSIAIDFFRARALSKVADATSSQALEADALHFSSDMWSSAAVLAGLAGLALGFAWADAAAALVVALFIIIAGWRLGRRTVEALTDTAPPGISALIRALVRGVKGVVDIEQLRARQVGPKLFVELSLAASRSLPLDRVATLKEAVVDAIRLEFAEAEIAVTVTPRALDDETVFERVMVIARNRALAVHHVTVHNIGGRLTVALDLEVDGKLSLARAHDIASGLEQAINEELGADVEVDTHIEPLQLMGVIGHDAPQQRVDAIRAELADEAAKLGVLRDIHDVRVRETDSGEIVNFHCQVDATLTVRDVHERVDEVERGLRRRFPQIARVVGHAEPIASMTLP